MKRVTSFLSSALAVLFVAVSVVPVSAATNQTSSGGPSSSTGLSIQPRKNYVVNPGQTVTDRLQVGNLDERAELHVTFRVIDFTYGGQGGSPKLSLAQNAPPTPWSLRPFMKLPDSVTVPAGQTTQFSYSISIPKNQGAGSYYGPLSDIHTFKDSRSLPNPDV